MKFSVDEALRKARTLSRGGDDAAAESLYRAILEKFPANRRALEELQALCAAKRENPPQEELDALGRLYQERRWTEGLTRAAELLRRYPHDEIVHFLAGALHAGAGDRERALFHFDEALALAPDYIEVHTARGNLLVAAGRYADALACFDAALGLMPDYLEAQVNRGAVLNKLKRFDDALAGLAEAIRRKPDCAEAYNNRGNVFLALNRRDDALADYQRATAINPHYADALMNRGNALNALGRNEEAVASFDQAIALAPGLAQAYNNRGIALRALKRIEEALASHERAFALNPDYVTAFGEARHIRAHMCRWTEAAGDAILPDQPVVGQAISPSYIFDIADDPRRHQAYARVWAEEKYGGIKPSPTPRSTGADRIRVGYFSSDFCNHATMYLMARLFELHDRTRFEIHVFSYSPKTNDEMQLRLREAVETFHDISGLDDREAAQLARSNGIDIAVDLKGYTQAGRAGIFAHRAAPVQVNYLGYPGTMGAEFIDYIIADPVVIPETHKHFYTEKVAYLPHSYQVNDDRRRISDRVFTRSELGLPKDGFVFCCFNNNYKISPAEFDIWMRLLATVEGSVLWLLKDNPWAAANLCREAEARGIDSRRLVFAERVSVADHLARHRCADLFLDTFNVNAHTTASDALWAGLPVVTKLGESFAARVASSLLHAMDLPELVTDSVEAYERLALVLATDRDRLATLKARTAERRTTAPLFDTARYARDLEDLYARLYGA